MGIISEVAHEAGYCEGHKEARDSVRVLLEQYKAASIDEEKFLASLQEFVDEEVTEYE